MLNRKSKKETEQVTPGVVVLCVQGSKTLFSYASGIATIQSEPLTIDSNFRIASVTKQCTAAAILQLIEKKKLALTTTLGALLSDCPKYARAITIQQLLCHTSGLPDYETKSAVDTFPRYQVTDKEVYAYYRDNAKKLLFPSGTRYAYSDGAYCILAVIVEKIAGISFAAYMQKHIFRKAPMPHSGFMRDTMPRRVFGFSYLPDSGWIPSDQRRTSATHGDGGLYSSARELVAWQQALYRDGRILNDESVQLMTNTHSSGEDGLYGFGIRIGTMNGKKFYYHGGSSIGFQSALFYVPAFDLSLVLLCNIHEKDMVRQGKRILKSMLR